MYNRGELKRSCLIFKRERNSIARDVCVKRCTKMGGGGQELVLSYWRRAQGAGCLVCVWAIAFPPNDSQSPPRQIAARSRPRQPFESTEQSKILIMMMLPYRCSNRIRKNWRGNIVRLYKGSTDGVAEFISHPKRGARNTTHGHSPPAPDSTLGECTLASYTQKH